MQYQGGESGGMCPPVYNTRTLLTISQKQLIQLHTSKGFQKQLNLLWMVEDHIDFQGWLSRACDKPFVEV